MTEGNRWKNLDFGPRPAPEVRPARKRRGPGSPGREGPGVVSERRSPERADISSSEAAPRLPAVVTQAAGAYMLRNYQAAVDLLAARVLAEPMLPGGQRVLGHAYARLSREPEAIACLREAVRQSSSDWLARASLATLLLRAEGGGRGGDGRAPAERVSGIRTAVAEAVALLEEAAGTATHPALRELLGAACWRSGQEALGRRCPADAARQFAAAGSEFALAAATSGAARRGLPARQAAAFVGQAVALLLEGRREAAQQLFSRCAPAGIAASDSLGRFAAGLYELCDELEELTAAERLEAAGALREVVLGVCLAVSFYDGRQAVSMSWTDTRG